jgi:chromosomal replication initiator protein
MTSPLLTRPGPSADASLTRLWATVLDEIRRDPAVSPANFSTWLRGTQLLPPVSPGATAAGPAGGALTDGSAAPSATPASAGEAADVVEYVVGAPHAFARDRLARAFRPAIERALARCLRRPGVRVRFAVADGPDSAVADGAPAGAAEGAPALDPRSTFDRFVAGRRSEFAVAAARAVADNPALAYNPLYLFGDPGTGKSHLLHAIGHRVLQRRPGSRVVCLSAAAPSLHLPPPEGLTLLLLDDVQRAAPAACESLLRLLVRLDEGATQVVVAGDGPPRELTALDGRLRAWLQSGLVAGIGAPDFETRLALVRQRAEALRATHARSPGGAGAGAAGVFTPAVAEVIARRAPADARELEGVVTRVVAGAELSGLPLTPEHVGAFLADVLGPAPSPALRRATAEEVLLATAATFGVSVADLKGRRRDKEVVLPRQVAMYLMRHETGASLAEIGAELGGRDHSTVIHGCERVTDALERDARLRGLVAAARQLVAGGAAPGRPPAAAGLD